MLLFFLAALLADHAPADARYPDAVEVFHCDFGPAEDKNFDGWPEAWTRQTGPGYPPYLSLGIVGDPTSHSKRAFAIRLDGGTGAAAGPKLPVHRQFSYVFEARVRTEGHPKPADSLQRNEATVSVTFYDAHERVLAVHHSPGLTHAVAWQRVRIGPVAPPAEAVSARLGLRLGPKHQGDLHGAAFFDDLWLGRLPRMSLTASQPHHIYHAAEPVKVACEISGIAERDPVLVFRLIDISRPRDLAPAREPAKPLAEHRVPVTGLAPLARPAGHHDTLAADASLPRDLVAGSAAWQPPIAQPGLYRIEAELVGKQGVLHRKEVQICVVPAQSARATGEFGWSLPRGDDPLPLAALVEMLGESGVSWVKFPVWYGEKEGKERADQLARFADQLSARGIELIGLLDQPPADQRAQFGAGQERLPAASIFAEGDAWRSALAPVFTRLSLKVRWWQLGRDDDTSFLGDPTMEKKLREARKELERFGQESYLGVAWPFTRELPPLRKTPWDFLALSERPELTAAELESYLADRPATSGTAWVVLAPLPKRDYDSASRMCDLVARMIACRIAGAGKVFVPHPFDDEQGLCTSGGQPDELFLPWRTTAHFLAGAKYLGSLDLPGGSTNHLFVRGDEAVLVVWSSRAGAESIYLGEKLRQHDLWARPIARPAGKTEELPVDVLPTFVTGVNLPIARWHMETHLSRGELASVFGRPQPVAVKFKNTFGQGVRIDVTVNGPETWDIRPRRQSVNLAAGEEGEAPFDIQLRSDASTGPQQVRIDFQVAAEQTYRFSIVRPLVVGLGDVQLELTSHLDAQGNLVVEQRLINTTTKPVNFNCYLFVPDRRRMRRQVIELSQGRDVKLYLLSEGRDLLGKTLWVRAEETDGDRVLNQRITAEE